MRRDPVESSAIASVGYDAASGTLELQFQGGAVYRYAGVPPQVVEALMAAESKGRFVNAHIRQRFPYERIA